MQEMDDMVDAEMLEIAANKHTILKNRIDADKKILEESREERLATTVDPKKSKNDRSAVFGKELVDSIAAMAKELDVPFDKKDIKLTATARAIQSMLKGKKGVQTILKNEEVLEMFNEEIIKVYGNQADATYNIFYKTGA